MNNFNDRFSFLVHPLLVSVYPVLFLYSRNIGETSLADTLAPAAVSFSAAAAMLVIAVMVSKRSRASALFVSALLLAFFGYGHAEALLAGAIRFRHPEYFLMPVFVTVSGLAGYFLFRSSSPLKNATNVANVFAVSLIMLSCLSVARFSINAPRSGDQIKNAFDARQPAARTDLPDVYYIILDGYAGQDALRDVFHFDNSEFLGFLKSKGFFVASKSMSNYAHTVLSLASSLNMTYVNNLIVKDDRREINSGLMYHLINDNAVQRKFKAYGYHTIHISSRTVLAGGNPYAQEIVDAGKISDFVYCLIMSTALRPFAGCLGFANYYRRQILNTFRAIPAIAKREQSTYVFAHIMAPHPPFLFKKNGMPNKHTAQDMIGFQWDDREGYIGQLEAVNAMVEDMVDEILNNSKQTPVIILQGDHGSASLFGDKKFSNWYKPDQAMLRERFSILNAILMPSTGVSVLPQNLSPVNTFSYVFNILPGEKNTHRHDSFFYSSQDDIFVLSDVSAILRQHD